MTNLAYRNSKVKRYEVLDGKDRGKTVRVDSTQI